MKNDFWVLGIGAPIYDASATLINEGDFAFACEEEKLVRKKHVGGFPFKAIEVALLTQNIKITDLSAIALAWQPWRGLLRRAYYYSLYPDISSKGFADKGKNFKYFKNMLNLRMLLAKKFGVKKKEIPKVDFVEHHQAHAAAGFYSSGFKEAVILTIDACGEECSLMVSLGRDNQISPEFRIFFPHSLGIFYGSLTQFLGFKLESGEGKVMGLASYGNPSVYEKDLLQTIRSTELNKFSLNNKFFNYVKGIREPLYSKYFEDKFGKPRAPESEISQAHKDLAAATQKITEDILLNFAKTLYQRYKIKNLVMGGGVALNCVANERILKESEFRDVYIYPASGDAGTSAGAALLTLKKYRNNIPVSSKKIYTGPSFENRKILDIAKKMCDEKAYKVEYIDNFIDDAAEILSKGGIIGWFQGRTEFGPRALGNRSILADPRDKNMKDKVNLIIKRREMFRPFAPVVLEEEADKFFEIDRPSPFMLFVKKVKPDYAEMIPAVIHIDNTARVQTVNKEENYLLYGLLEKFKDKVGLPILLNTSFNLRGEPMVSSPSDAIDCFFRTELDALIMGNIKITRKCVYKKS